MLLVTRGIAGHDECRIEVQEIREHLHGCRIRWQIIGNHFGRATGAMISPCSLSAGTLKFWSLPLECLPLPLDCFFLLLPLEFLMRSLSLFS